MTSIIDNTLNKHSADAYTLRPATLNDAFEIWTIMDISSKAIEHKEHFLCDDFDYVKEILSGHGFGVVACDATNKIVGNLLVKYPGLGEENLGYDVCFSPENLNRVLHMDSASVLPKHRGHGLEGKMIAFAESLVDTSKYRYSFATVAPENYASLKSLERNGYEVMVTKEKYDGLVRYVMMKVLE